MTTAEILGHLSRRAGFGARTEQLTAMAAAGYDTAVRDLVAGIGAPDPGADPVPVPELSAPPSAGGRLAMSVAARRSLDAQLREEFTALTAWWLGRMVATTNPLKEKLTLLLHGHFPTAVSKVRFPVYMYGQNQLFRTQGGGDFAVLTELVAQDPAMLIWLDANSNRASDPNENFARELMERFTMGIGTYTQADVRAASYCFTGWRVDPRTGGFDVDARLHSTAPQTFLGVSGVSSGQQVIDLVTQSQASSRYVPSRLWSFLAYPVGPDDPVVADLAPGYAADHNVANLLAAIFGHPQFTAPQSLQGLVKQPVEYVVGALRALGMTPADVSRTPAALLRVLAGLGQVPFDPPSVGGWPQNEYWLSASAALTRWQFAHALARRADISMVADASPNDRVDAAGALLGVFGWSAATAAALQRASADPPTLVTLALVSPEYVSN
ncbi:MAG TPA: DUF1800 domain-containing protein [Acidimicrobiales bacterium]|nr:DUF1800 domain-containing protein [Acidimicrobiales bacterium]